MKVKLNRLEGNERLRAFRYHIKGIVEAAENITGLVKRMNDSYQRDATEYAETSSLLEVEALDHLGYHVKQLRRPLLQVQRDAYAELEQIEASTPPRTSTGRRRKPTRRF
jgi:hypothetical protein